jgi:hypothetical protein
MENDIEELEIVSLFSSKEITKNGILYISKEVKEKAAQLVEQHGYSTVVNALIKHAEREARRRMKLLTIDQLRETYVGLDGKRHRIDNFSIEFHKVMNEVKKSVGLISW